MQMSEISKIIGGVVPEKNKTVSQVDRKLCVACGCCVKVCPLEAITIHKGVYAYINEDKCVGCRKCTVECPASIITMTEVDR